ncbi:MAG: hypothetical protein DRQ10_08175, partial [Candidatus Hydrothermota bacterium]
MNNKNKPSVLIIGGGVAGSKAAIDLSYAGVQVYLIDRAPGAGGELLKLDHQFPTDDCGLCKTLFFSEAGQYCMKRSLSSPNLSVHTLTEVVGVEEHDGRYKVKLRTKPRGVDMGLCIDCGLCVDVCPVKVNDTDKAILRFVGAQGGYVINWEACTLCGECVKVCPTNAINLESRDSVEFEVEVDAIIIAAGFKEYEPHDLPEFKWGKNPDVLTSPEMELRIRHGKAGQRPSNGERPQKIAFLQCVGSRDTKRAYCSSACCMYALKEARLLKAQLPDAEIKLFAMDLRAFGKGYYRYRKDTERMGVKIENYRIPTIEETGDGKLAVRYEVGGELVSEDFDLVVLATGQQPSKGLDELAKVIGVEVHPTGYIQSTDPSRVMTSKPKVFAAGTTSGPKDIPDTVVSTAASVAKTLGILGQNIEKQESGSFKFSPEPKIGVFISRCGGLLDDKLDVQELAELVKVFAPEVVHVEVVDALTEPTIESIANKLKDMDIDRVLLAGRNAFNRRVLFEQKLGEIAGINPFLIEVVDIYEWHHSAPQIVVMGIEKLRNSQVTLTKPINPIPSLLVLGGGVAGLNAAIAAASAGIKVYLVEKTDQLIGNGKYLAFDSTLKPLAPLFKKFTDGVLNNPNVEVLFNSEIIGLEGSLGRFEATVKTPDGTRVLKVGSVIIATGAKPYTPEQGEFGYGLSDKVMLVSDLEKRLGEGNVDGLNRVVFIQCVGSRNEKHTWCSRFCCMETVKNTLKLKELNPDIEVFVLHRDIMTYGLNELFYLNARKKGVIFVRFPEGREPEVEIVDGRPVVRVFDVSINKVVELQADAVALANGVVPNEDNPKLADIFGITLDADGFFAVMNPKFRPLETKRPGVFVAGLANMPLGLEESIAQGIGAAGEALKFLLRGRLQNRYRISVTRETRCAGCGYCVEACPFGARYIDEETRVAKVTPEICEGCGICVAACPSHA